MIADLIAAGLQSGCIVLRRPAIPETWGHAIEVPDIKLKCTRRRSPGTSVGPDAPVKAARILTPGAVMSGWNHHMHSHYKNNIEHVF